MHVYIVYIICHLSFIVVMQYYSPSRPNLVT